MPRFPSPEHGSINSQSKNSSLHAGMVRLQHCHTGTLPSGALVQPKGQSLEALVLARDGNLMWVELTRVTQNCWFWQTQVVDITDHQLVRQGQWLKKDVFAASTLCQRPCGQSRSQSSDRQQHQMWWEEGLAGLRERERLKFEGSEGRGNQDTGRGHSLRYIEWHDLLFFLKKGRERKWHQKYWGGGLFFQ